MSFAKFRETYQNNPGILKTMKKKKIIKVLSKYEKVLAFTEKGSKSLFIKNEDLQMEIHNLNSKLEQLKKDMESLEKTLKKKESDSNKWEILYDELMKSLLTYSKDHRDIVHFINSDENVNEEVRDHFMDFFKSEPSAEEINWKQYDCTDELMYQQYKDVLLVTKIKNHGRNKYNICIINSKTGKINGGSRGDIIKEYIPLADLLDSIKAHNNWILLDNEFPDDFNKISENDFFLCKYRPLKTKDTTAMDDMYCICKYNMHPVKRFTKISQNPKYYNCSQYDIIKYIKLPKI